MSTSAGKMKRPAGVKEPSPKWMASFKKGVDDYARAKAAREANRPSTLTVTRIERKGASV